MKKYILFFVVLASVSVSGQRAVTSLGGQHTVTADSWEIINNATVYLPSVRIKEGVPLAVMLSEGMQYSPRYYVSNDSIPITLSVQARDLEFITSFLFEKPEYEDLYDSVKIAFRGKQNPPQGNTPVPITAIAGDWFRVYQDLINNELAWHSGTKNRFEALLTAAAATYPFITDKLTSLTAYLDNSFTEARRQGRQKLRRVKQ